MFQMKRMMKYSCEETSPYSCFKLDVVGELAEKHKLVDDSLEICITQSRTTEDEDPDIKTTCRVVTVHESFKREAFPILKNSFL